MMAYINASGRGGQPGTYTSTGKKLSTPGTVEYEPWYGPPAVAHTPIEITYFGSAIWSYIRRMGCAILTTTVPETIMMSAWRGEARLISMPKRDKSKREFCTP